VAASTLVLVLAAALIGAARKRRTPCGRHRSNFHADLHAAQNLEHIAATSMVGEATTLLQQLRQSKSTTRLVGQIMLATKERAEARFVIEYRQLVTSRSMAEFQCTLKQLEAPRGAVRLGAELGRGQSGIVWKGDLAVPLEVVAAGTNPAAGAATTIAARPVAVKTRGDVDIAASTVADEALLVEAMLLNGLQHPHILRLVAIVSERAPVLLCTELMGNGDLRGYLRACRPDKADRRAVVSTVDMLTIGSKLASAMAYLEGRSVIHRDVAARNVLVGDVTTDVKIADLEGRLAKLEALLVK
jgi:hypothetical protein